jgi:hypothetical protein
MINDVDKCKAAVETGTDVDQLDKSGMTALYVACAHGSVNAAVYLLNKGADCKKKSMLSHELYKLRSGFAGNTIIHVAALKSVSGARKVTSNSSLESIGAVETGPGYDIVSSLKVLLRAFPQGASSRNAFGQLPLGVFLERNNRREIAASQLAIAAVTLLLEHNAVSVADLCDICDQSFQSVMHTDTAVRNRKLVRMLGAAVAYDIKKDCIPVHLFGDSFAGKTTLRSALSFSLSEDSAAVGSRGFLKGGLPKNVSQDVSIHGRTMGIDIEVMQESSRVWVLFDYGGNRHPHVDHSRLLARSIEPIYIIVVPLVDARDQRIIDETTVLDRYNYWVQYINSFARDDRAGATCHIVTVINFVGKAGIAQAAQIKRGLITHQHMWSSDSTNYINFVDTLSIDVDAPKLIKNSLVALLDKVSCSRAVTPVPLSVCLNALRQSKFAEGSKWPKVMHQNQFCNEYVMPILEPLRKLDSRVSSTTPPKKTVSSEQDFDTSNVNLDGVENAVITFLYQHYIEHLVELGDIIMLSSEGAGNDSWIITDINWLTNDMLHQLAIKTIAFQENIKKQFGRHQRLSLHSYLLSRSKIAKFSGCNERFVSTLLTRLGILLPHVYVEDEVENEIENSSCSVVGRESIYIISGALDQSFRRKTPVRRMWFPFFALKSRVDADDCVFPAELLGEGLIQNNRIILRRFELRKMNKKCWPHNFLGRLFVFTSSLERGSQNVKLFDDALYLESTFSCACGNPHQHEQTNRIVIVLRIGEDESVCMTVGTSTHCPVSVSPSRAWIRAQLIAHFIYSIVEGVDQPLTDDDCLLEHGTIDILDRRRKLVDLVDEVCIDPASDHNEFPLSALNLDTLHYPTYATMARSYYGTAGDFLHAVIETTYDPSSNPMIGMCCASEDPLQDIINGQYELTSLESNSAFTTPSKSEVQSIHGLAGSTPSIISSPIPITPAGTDTPSFVSFTKELFDDEPDTEALNGISHGHTNDIDPSLSAEVTKKLFSDSAETSVTVDAVPLMTIIGTTFNAETAHDRGQDPAENANYHSGALVLETNRDGPLTMAKERINRRESDLPKRQQPHQYTSLSTESVKFPLHTACQEGDYDACRRIIQQGKIDINADNAAGKSCLELACKHGHIDIALLLLISGCHANKWAYKITSGFAANKLLHWAALKPLEFCPEDRYDILTAARTVLRHYPSAATSHNAFGQLPLGVFLEKHNTFDLVESEVAINFVHEMLEHSQLSILTLQEICNQAYQSVMHTETAMKNRKLLMMLGTASVYDRHMDCASVHLFGDSFSGKTTLRSAVSFSLSGDAVAAAKRGVFRTSVPKSVSQDVSINGRTMGIDIEVMQESNRVWVIHDYGGNRHHHVDHSKLLVKNSQPMYVVVIPLFDIRNSQVIDESTVMDRYNYWMQYINSVSRNEKCGGPCQVITVVNFSRLAGNLISKQIMLAAKQLQLGWQRLQGNQVKFVDTIVVDVDSPKAMKTSLVPILVKALNSRNVSPIPICACINSVKRAKFSETARWPRVIHETQFRNEYIVPILNVLKRDSTAAATPASSPFRSPTVLHASPVPASSTPISSSGSMGATSPTVAGAFGALETTVINHLYQYILRRLRQLGDVIMLSSEETENDSWIITDLNWLTNDMLHKVATQTIAFQEAVKMHAPPLEGFQSGGSGLSLYDFLISRGKIAKFSGCHERYIPTLLTRIGVLLPLVYFEDETSCRPTPSTRDSMLGGRESVYMLDSPFDQSVRRGTRARRMWFPFFALTSRKSANDCVFPSGFLLQGLPQNNRIIMRRFELRKGSKKCWPHNFMGRLFLFVCSLERNSRNIKMFDDALYVENSFTGACDSCDPSEASNSSYIPTPCLTNTPNSAPSSSPSCDHSGSKHIEQIVIIVIFGKDESVLVTVGSNTTCSRSLITAPTTAAAAGTAASRAWKQLQCISHFIHNTVQAEILHHTSAHSAMNSDSAVTEKYSSFSSAKGDLEVLDEICVDPATEHQEWHLGQINFDLLPYPSYSMVARSFYGTNGDLHNPTFEPFYDPSTNPAFMLDHSEDPLLTLMEVPDLKSSSQETSTPQRQRRADKLIKLPVELVAVDEIAAPRASEANGAEMERTRTIVFKEVLIENIECTENKDEKEPAADGSDNTFGSGDWFLVGALIEADAYNTGEYVVGEVAKVHADGTYDVRCAGGEQYFSVSRNHVRPPTKLAHRSISYLRAFDILAENGVVQRNDQEIEVVSLRCLIGRVTAEDIWVGESKVVYDEDDDDNTVVESMTPTTSKANYGMNHRGHAGFGKILEEIPVLDALSYIDSDVESDISRLSSGMENGDAAEAKPHNQSVASLQSAATTTVSAGFLKTPTDCPAITAHTRIDAVDICILGENGADTVRCFNKPVVGVVTLLSNVQKLEPALSSKTLPASHAALISCFSRQSVGYSHQQHYSCRDFGVTDKFQLSAITHTDVRQHRHLYSPHDLADDVISEVGKSGSCEVLVVIVRERDGPFTDCTEYLSNWNKSEILTTHFTSVEDKDIMFVTRDKEILHGHNPRKLIRKRQRQGAIFFIREQCLQDMLGLKTLLVDGFLNVLEGIPVDSSFGELYSHHLFPSNDDGFSSVQLSPRLTESWPEVTSVTSPGSTPQSSPHKYNSKICLFDTRDGSSLGFHATLSDRYCQLSSTSSEDAFLCSKATTHQVNSIAVSDVVHHSSSKNIGRPPTGAAQFTFSSSQGLAKKLMSSIPVVLASPANAEAAGNEVSTIASQTSPRVFKRLRVVRICFVIVKDPAQISKQGQPEPLVEADFRNLLAALNGDTYYHDIGSHHLEMQSAAVMFLTYNAPLISTICASLLTTGQYDLVVSLGCVGFGANDQMPDIVRSLIDKEINGVVHDMLAVAADKDIFLSVPSSTASPSQSINGNSAVFSASRVNKSVCGTHGSSLLCCIEDRCIEYDAVAAI